jgi:hypothetical protein
MDTFNSQNTKNSQKNYSCSICNYITIRKNDFNKHILTAKHIRDTNKIHNDTNNSKKNYNCKCGKEYKYSQGLSKHKKSCNYKPIEEPSSTEITPSMDIINTNTNNNFNTDVIIDIIKENKEIKTLLIEQNKQVIELYKENNILNKENNKLINQLIEKESNTTINNNNTTNNNQKFNLNFFLNETCKDAMNLKEFIDNIIVSFEELLTIGNTGFVNGVSEIFIKRLKELEVTKRPIHCTDVKRETIYLKNDDKWNKDENNNKNLKDVIEKVEYKNIYSLNEWCNENPDAFKSNTKNNDLWLKIYEQTIQGNDDTREKVVKNITKKVTIDKDL